METKSKKRGRSRVCSIIGCSNGDYQLAKWREEHTKIHNSCSCDAPFTLFTFPTKRANIFGRKKWKKLINRVNSDKSPWTPGKQSRVCSKHFIDGKPTSDNPFPTLHLGYNSTSLTNKICKQPRRKLHYFIVSQWLGYDIVLKTLHLLH